MAKNKTSGEAFLAKRCANLHELEVKRERRSMQYPNCETVVRNGANQACMGLINDTVHLVFVGTAIPEGLTFPYTGDNKTPLKRIDDVFKTDLVNRAEQGDIDGIRQELISLGIAFIDVTETIWHKMNSSKDRDIKGYLVDETALNLLKKLQAKKGDNLKIISISKAAQAVLDDFGIVNIPCGLFYQSADPWIEALKALPGKK